MLDVIVVSRDDVALLGGHRVPVRAESERDAGKCVAPFRWRAATDSSARIPTEWPSCAAAAAGTSQRTAGMWARAC